MSTIRLVFERAEDEVRFRVLEVVPSSVRRPRSFTLTFAWSDFPAFVSRVLRVRYAHRKSVAQGLSLECQLDGDVFS